jgi:hypothetical protein
MKKEHQARPISSQEALAPDSLRRILALSQDASFFEGTEIDEAGTISSFRVRCRDAAKAALAIAKLGKERRRVGFIPLALTDYISGLAKIAGVSLAEVFVAFGIVSSYSLGPDGARALGRLARDIGMGLRETLVNMRIGFAAEHDSPPMSLLVAHRRPTGPGRNQLEECEELLKQVESTYSARDVRELRNIEHEIEQAYEVHGASI